MKHTARLLAVVGIIVCALSACGDGSVAQSHGDTTSGSPAGQSVVAAEIDSLVVPMAQVPDTADSLRHSTVEHQPGQDLIDPCWPVAQIGSDRVAFRYVRYGGFSNVFVVQEIGVYAASGDASAAFQSLANELEDCKNTDGGPSVDSITSKSAIWHAIGFSPVVGEDAMLYASEARIMKNVVFRVTAGLFSNAQQIVASVSDQIAAKIANTV